MQIFCGIQTNCYKQYTSLFLYTFALFLNLIHFYFNQISKIILQAYVYCCDIIYTYLKRYKFDLYIHLCIKSSKYKGICTQMNEPTCMQMNLLKEQMIFLQ